MTVASAAALVLAVVPGTALAAEVRDTAAVCDGEAAEAPSDTEGTTHEDPISCVIGLEIASGYEDGSYKPGRDVTRAQMATFVGRALLVADAVASEVAENLEGGSFPDTPGTTHEPYIELLAELGVVAGKDDGTFGYNDSITRGQMAAFLTRAIDHAHGREMDGSMPPAASGDDFDDIEGTAFEEDIQQLADQGIYVGDGEGTADPGGFVTRGQMASFLARTASYLDELRRWRPTYEPIDYTVQMSPENVTDGEGTYDLGEEGASGAFRIVVDEIERVGAYAIQVDGVTPPFAEDPISVNVGGVEEVSDDVVIAPSEDPASDLADDNAASGQLTIAADADLDALFETPGEFYVEVRTEAYAEGAIRGQLPEGGEVPGGGEALPIPGELQDAFDELLGLLDGGEEGSPLDGLLDALGLGGDDEGGDDAGGDDGSPLDPITDPLAPITDPLAPITDPLAPVTDPLCETLGLCL